MEQYILKKKVFFDERAYKEFIGLPRPIKNEFNEIIKRLELKGYLVMPYTKKINHKLFEIKIRTHGAWRGLYSYLKGNRIVILRVFNKKDSTNPSK